jgi:hypothetical protein
MREKSEVSPIIPAKYGIPLWVHPELGRLLLQTAFSIIIMGYIDTNQMYFLQR